MAETSGMDQSLPIGEFARLTLLPVKTLRHYHDVGVVVPAVVDPATGYRRYALDQVPDAHLVRRLRGLDMPLAEIRTALEAPDQRARNQVILTFLGGMERRLAEAQLAVASLRALLEEPPGAFPVTRRRFAAMPAVALAAEVERVHLADWCAATYPRLYEAVAASGEVPAGPGGGLYPPGFFENGVGRVVAFVPLRAWPDLGGGDRPGRGPFGGVEAFEVPATVAAVAVHHGSFDDLDRTYGSLGSYVASNDLGRSGTIREHYLVSPADSDDPRDLRTEVCWPIHDHPQGDPS
jgi:DNA-binding transcriptional MerR regulator